MLYKKQKQNKTNKTQNAPKPKNQTKPKDPNVLILKKTQ